MRLLIVLMSNTSNVVIVNSSLVEQGGRFGSEEVVRRAPPFFGDQLFGVIPMHVVWNFTVVLLVILIFWWLIRGSHKNGETAMDLLKRRYVAGELDRETYLRMKSDITD